MIALMKKDWRLFRVPVVGAIMMHIIPYLVSGFIMWWVWHNMSSRDVAAEIMGMAGAGMGVNVIIAAVLGGAAMAQERRDRSADFQAMLPVTRAQIIASKVLVSAGILLALFIFDVSIFLLARSAADPSTTILSHDGADNFEIFLSITLLAFGAAWLGGSFLSSPAIAASASLVLLLISILWPNLLPNTVHISGKLVALGSNFALGLGTFVAGTIYYLKRVEP